MNWQIEFDDKARKLLLRLDKPARNKIVTFLERLVLQSNPRLQGKALTGNYAGLWRYRVGDYRLICHIEDNRFTILVVELGHRKDIYK
jgi:mRNA interferase RelE/StbE